jgi:hypothetical protein
VVWGREWFIRIRPEPDGSGPDHWEPGLLLDAAGPTRGTAVASDPVRP